MDSAINYWKNLYNTFKRESLCLDIEVTEFNGPISVIGLYVPKEGLIECQNFIRGKDLKKENLKPLFDKTKLIITFNGLYFDIPKIKSEFPGLIPPGMRILDLHLFAKKLNYWSSLRTLENTFGIERLTPESEKKRVAVKLWKEYLQGNPEALKKLIEYNSQDTVNLYFLAEELMKLAEKFPGSA